eukprot:1181048-Prorocentrum_minimum.AAC.1
MAAALEYAKKKREKEGKAPLAEFKTMSQEQRKPEEETRAEETPNETQKETFRRGCVHAMLTRLRRHLGSSCQGFVAMPTVGSRPPSSSCCVFYSTTLHAHHRTTPDEWNAIVDKEPSKMDSQDRMAAALAAAKKQREKEGKAPLDFKNMTQEQMSREEEKRALEKQKGMVTEVKMLTKEGNYRPTVSTWGVFPRPDNISKAYGGGRTLKPGGELVRPSSIYRSPLRSGSLVFYFTNIVTERRAMCFSSNDVRRLALRRRGHTDSCQK